MSVVSKTIQQNINAVLKVVPTDKQIQTIVNTTLSANELIPPCIIEQDLNEALTDPTNTNNVDRGSIIDDHCVQPMLQKTGK